VPVRPAPGLPHPRPKIALPVPDAGFVGVKTAGVLGHAWQPQVRVVGVGRTDDRRAHQLMFTVAADVGFVAAVQAVKAWSMANGLPYSSVTALAQTSDGYL